MRDAHAVCWRRLDIPGHEGARLTRTGAGWRLTGTAVLAVDGSPSVLTYSVECDDRWRTRAGTVRGFIGEREVVRDVFVDAQGRWYTNGVECHAVHGAVDLDLEFSPSTSLFLVRRLGLGIGEGASVRSAWLRFPVLTIEPVSNRFVRLDESSYRYESERNGRVCTLTVDPAGFATRFGDVWQVEDGWVAAQHALTP